MKKLKIKIFADGANIIDMFLFNKKKYISGFTTNPSLMSQQKIFDYKTYAKKIVNVIKENHKVRHFSLSDLSRLCNKYRFKCLHVRELISNNKPSKNTWGVFCLLRKY